jgi:DNA-binding CsgD family transcriptional regulator
MHFQSVRFIEAVEAIYDAAPDPSLWPHALQSIAGVFNDVGANLLWQRDDGGFGVILSSRLDQTGAREYHDKWSRLDIRALRSPESFFRNPGHAITDRHVATPEEIETHPIYTEFLAKYGLKWVAGMFVSPDPRTFVSINVQRTIDRQPFTDEELDVLAKLSQHAEKSLRLSIRLFDAELEKLGLIEALARLDIAVFVLDREGGKICANAIAEMLQLDFAVNVGGPERSQAELVVSSADGAFWQKLDPEKPNLLQLPSKSRPIVAYLLPISNLRSPDSGLSNTRYIVLMMDPAADRPPDPSLVRDILGLTLAEARVASLVGSGVGPKEAALKLGIAEETARTALKRVFEKTRVSRQSELGALLARLVLR